MTALAGIDELRRMLDSNNEDFNQRFTAEQLLAICRANRQCDWDYYPCQWTGAQVQTALRGEVPRWDDNGKGFV
jgi:hypothetical protein